MKQFFRGLNLGTKIIFIPLFSIFVAFIYTLVAYLLVGHEIISKGAIGSDAWSFISHMKLLSESFPYYSFWNPREGGGVSLIYSYPFLIHTIIIITSRFAHITLAEAFKLWEFICVPIFAFGVFVYTWVRLKITVVAFLAGLFFIISPIAWMWPFEWGFIAEAIAAMFFPYIILFFDLFLLRVLKRDWSLKTRIFLLCTVVLFGLSLMAHPFVFTGTLSFMLVYGFFLGILKKEKKLKSLVLAIGSVLGVFFLTTLFTAFWAFPFNNYNGIAISSSTGANSGKPRMTNDWDKVDLTFSHVFSFAPPRIISKDAYFLERNKLREGDSLDGNMVLEKGYIWRNFSFPLAISIFYFLGIATSFILWKRKLPHLLLTSLLLVLISVSTPFIFYMATASYYVAKIPIFGSYIAGIIGWLASWRGDMFAAKLLVPIGAGFGAYGIFAVILYPLRFLDKYIVLRFLKSVALFILSISLAFLILYYFRYKPALSSGFLVYGKEVSFFNEAIRIEDIFQKYTPSLCEYIVNRDKPVCKNKLFNTYFDPSRIIYSCNIHNIPLCSEDFSDVDVEKWRKICDGKTNNSDSFKILCTARKGSLEIITSQLTVEEILEQIKKFPQKEFILGDGSSINATRGLLSVIPDDVFVRYDVSPGFVGISMMGPYLKNTPQLGSYITRAFLIERLAGYELSSLYAPDPVYDDPQAIPEIAQWFGVKYIIAGSNDKKIINNKFFKQIDNSTVYAYEKGEPLAVVSHKPIVLVIGSDSLRVYENIFKLAPYGLLSYDKAFLVKGKDNIDDYSLADLKKFEILYLSGYKYKNRGRAWNLLNQYVQEGGKLFIDTGWQYYSADWNTKNTPEFFPTTSLSWTNFGKTNNYQLDDKVIDGKDINVLGFEPLVWGNEPWGVSSGDQLRSWAKPILSVDGHPLVAGGVFGSGKVVWSGMNLVGHMKRFDRKNDEMKFSAQIMSWLLDGSTVKNYVFRKDFDANRVSADKIEFTFNMLSEEPVSLYFKEADHPYWKAEYISSTTSKEIPIYRAGPGFKLMYFPKINSGDKVILYVKTPFINYFYDFISLFILVALLIFIVLPRLFKPKFVIIRFNKHLHIKNPVKNIVKDFMKDDEDY